MQAVTPPVIPDSFKQFAEEVAAAATKHGIDSCVTTFRPDYDTSQASPWIRTYGEMQIIFSKSDGRGRPCRNLSIELKATHTVTIEHHHPSSS